MRRRRNYRFNKYMWNGGVSNSNIPTSTQKKGMVLKRSPNVSQSQKNHFSNQDMYKKYWWLYENRIFHLPPSLEIKQFTFRFFDLFPYDQTSPLEQVVGIGYNTLLPGIASLCPEPNPGCHLSFVITGVELNFPPSVSYNGVNFHFGYGNEMLLDGAVDLVEPFAPNVPYVAPETRQKLFFNLAPVGAQTCYIQSFKQIGQAPYNFEFTRLNPPIDQDYTPFDETTHGLCPFIYNEEDLFNATKSGTFTVYYPPGQINDNENLLITFYGFTFEVAD